MLKIMHQLLREMKKENIEIEVVKYPKHYEIKTELGNKIIVYNDKTYYKDFKIINGSIKIKNFLENKGLKEIF